MINDISHFFTHKFQFVAPEISYHYATLLKVYTFKFFYFWTRDSNFMDVVKNSWEEPVPAGTLMARIFTKLKRLKIQVKMLKVCLNYCS